MTDRAPDTRPTPARRDASSALAAAEAMLQRAKDAAKAVEAYHDAADRIDAARTAESAATADRAKALKQLRVNGLPVGQISELTGLSESRIQTIVNSSK